MLDVTGHEHYQIVPILETCASVSVDLTLTGVEIFLKIHLFT